MHHGKYFITLAYIFKSDSIREARILKCCYFDSPCAQ